MKSIESEIQPPRRRRIGVLPSFVVAAIACLLLATWVNAQLRTVEDWTSQPLNVKGVPGGWKKLTDTLSRLERAAMLFVPSGNYDLEVVTVGEERALHLKSAGDHSIIVKELVGVDLAATPRLEWKWRVDELPRGGNLRENDQSDSAAEIHLFWKAQKRTLGYAWDETTPVDTPFKNPRPPGIDFIVVTSGKARPGEWMSVTRDVAADYRTVFNAEPPGPPDQIAISIDSNQTRSRAESYIGAIRFRGR